MPRLRVLPLIPLAIALSLAGCASEAETPAVESAPAESSPSATPVDDTNAASVCGQASALRGIESRLFSASGAEPSEEVGAALLDGWRSLIFVSTDEVGAAAQRVITAASSAATLSDDAFGQTYQALVTACDAAGTPITMSSAGG